MEYTDALPETPDHRTAIMNDRLLSLIIGVSLLFAASSCRTPSAGAEAGEFACVELSFAG